MLATGVLGVIVAIAAVVCFFSSICTVSGGVTSGDRMSFAVWAIISLAIAVGGAMLIGKINREE
jgi:hypothetical protein